jgi:molybdopterin-containing oxidoreductase family membrane subunit
MQRIEDFDDIHVSKPPVIEPGHSMVSVTEKITAIVLKRKTGIGWLIGFLMFFGLAQLLPLAVGNLLLSGVGIWGNNVPVAWAFDIINFVWWIGIGHAGTLISAILLLMRQSWRTSINRFAEAMTLFAVACAGLFPALHTGRPWMDYYLFPLPNTMGMWPNFRSPLMWDVFAVSTYATVSALFWYVGLVPDLATMRDKAKNKFVRILTGILSLGWRGSASHWDRYEKMYLILAGLSTPLVLSVHSIVSFDFAVAQLPGWHATIFPPYFVAGAIYAGFAMVLTIAIPFRKFFNLKDMITDRHIDFMAKVTLATGLIVFYGYIMEAFFAWYSANETERFMMSNRAFGPYGWSYWALIFCNGIAPQILWVKKFRDNTIFLWLVCQIVSVGMWLERFVIIVTSLNRDFIPGNWAMYQPTMWDFMTFLGTIGMFFSLMYLFIRFVPAISIFEVRTLLPESKVKE